MKRSELKQLIKECINESTFIPSSLRNDFDKNAKTIMEDAIKAAMEGGHDSLSAYGIALAKISVRYEFALEIIKKYEESGSVTESLGDADGWAKYENLLKKHDWYYEYSDDHSAWSAGLAERKILEALKKQLSAIDSVRAEALWKKYAA